MAKTTIKEVDLEEDTISHSTLTITKVVVEDIITTREVDERTNFQEIGAHHKVLTCNLQVIIRCKILQLRLQ